MTTDLRTIYNENGTLDLVIGGDLYVNCKVTADNGADAEIDTDGKTIKLSAVSVFTFDEVIGEADRMERLKAIGATL